MDLKIKAVFIVIVSILLVGCAAIQCPEDTEDVGLGQCVPKDNK